MKIWLICLDDCLRPTNYMIFGLGNRLVSTKWQTDKFNVYGTYLASLTIQTLISIGDHYPNPIGAVLRSAYLTASQKSQNISAAFAYIPTHLCKVRNFDCFETSPGCLEYFSRSSAISSIVVVKHGHGQYSYITNSQ